MFRLVVLLSVVACAFGGAIFSNVPMPDGRIVGGENTDITTLPYQVSVRILGSHSCGGTILNERTVVTAAHCIYTFLGPSSYSIQYGVTTIGGSENVVYASKISVHEKYNSNVIDYDVAVIILVAPIRFSSNAQPIGGLADSYPKDGTPAITSGWGTTTENGSSSKTLQSVTVNVVDPAVCAKQYSGVNEITDRMVCAGVNGGGKDACQGDSGGPLVSHGVLIGVVSWGVGCAREGYSGVYSNVANLRSWIEEHAF